MKNYSKEQVLTALDGSCGIVSVVAQRLACDWHTAKKYIDKWQETQELHGSESPKLNNIAYKSFIRAVGAGEKWAVERVLDTSARRDGHGLVSHSKIDHTTDGEKITGLQIEFVPPGGDAKDAKAVKDAKADDK